MAKKYEVKKQNVVTTISQNSITMMEYIVEVSYDDEGNIAFGNAMRKDKWLRIEKLKKINKNNE